MANATSSRPLSLYLAGMAAVFFGERLLGEGHALRMPVDAAGGLLLGLSILAAAARFTRASGGAAAIAARHTAHMAAGVASLGLYALSLPGAALGGGDVSVVLRALWPVLWLAGTLPAVLMAFSLRSTSDDAPMEVRRIEDSGAAGLALALAFAWIVALNYVADARDQRFDFRTVKEVVASEATVEMVRNLPEPVTITLFFPPADEVGEIVAPYFASLHEVNEGLVIDRMDRDMHPRRAKEMRVRKNGTVVVSRGDVHETISLDTDPTKARRKLKELDKDFRASLAKVSRDQRVAYVVSGHGERSFRPAKDDPTPGLKDLRKVLEALNYKVQKLGLADGLGVGVPEDATLVILPAPTSPMLAAEQDALIRYFLGGGALMVLLDPDVESDPQLIPLLTALGVQVDLTPLIHDSKYVRLTRGETDRGVLYTNRFMAHDSTRALAKLSTKLAVVFPHTGSVSPLKDVEGVKYKATVRSLSDTAVDADRDFQVDPDEGGQVFDLVAAVEQEGAPEGSQPGRAIVTADVDVVSDLVLHLNAGNQQFLVDAVRWLEGEVELSGEVAAMEDVPLLHTREEDKALFYGSVALVPLALFAVGGLMWRRRREGSA